jgi:hypothetical protein
MKKVFWKKTIFWEGIKRTCAVYGAPTTAGLSFMDADSIWVITSGVIAGLGAFLAIWLTDKNNNGVIDLFE